MSVIQDIRDKYAKWAVVAIALSLIGFILMDAFTGRSNMFGNSSTTVGKINGKKLDYVDFEKKVKNQEDMARQQGQERGPEARKEYIDNVWNEEVSTKLVNDETDELGIRVTVKEMDDYLFGSNPPQDLKQRFVDSATGGYDAVAAQQAIAQMKRTARPEDRAQFDQYINALMLNRKFEKYNSLLINSVYIPKWLVEKQNSDNSLVAKTAYVTVPYSTIADSTIKISDDEIKDYINKHKKLFEVKEETRTVNYVVFNAAPNAKDSNDARTFLESKRVAFDTAKDYEAFLRDNNSPMSFYDGFVSKNAMKQPNKDAILSAPVGTVYGPYVDPGQGGSYFVMSKILAVRNTPDTVKVRHILISTTQRDPQTGQMTPVRDSADARKLTDSVRSLLAAGQSFDSLVVKFSEDPGSKETGGVYDNVTSGQMTSEFNDYIFTNPVGKVGVVKTEFGYHILEVLSQKGSSQSYKIAYFSTPITSSQETDNIANTEATNFASESRSEKAFNDNFANKLQKKGYTKLVATNIHPNDFTIQSLGVSRELVKEIFEAKQGDVLQPQRVGEAYVVAVVTGIDEAGLQSVATARPVVEPALRNKKKAEQIRKKIGKITTLEAAATAVGQPVITADSLRFSGGNNALGFEFRLTGAAFNPDNKGKVVPEVIEGQAGVYVLRVDAVSAVASQTANVEEQRTMMRMQQRQSVNPIEGLKAAADIKDYRAKFF
jgi:peptidyl-prolyl cis-trans isomerase D